MHKIILLILCLFVPFANVSAQTSSITSVIINGENIQIGGTGFGVKSVAAPRYFSNWDAHTLDVHPSDWQKGSGTPTVTDTRAYSGSQAVEFVNVDGDFQQIRRDMGEFTETAYFCGKIYIDNSADTLTSYQFKGIRFSSSPGAYNISEEPTTSIILYDSWWLDGSGWHNTGSPHCYYNGGTNGGSLSAPADLFPFNQWFDYRVIVKRSSTPSVADGAVYNYINGELKSSKTDFITHDSDDGNWRYMLMGGTITSGAGGIENIRVYYDDFYVDDSIAHVEIGDNQTYTSCTKLEIQPATSWVDNSVTVTANHGTFNGGDMVYVFVVDSAGTVSDQDAEAIGAQGFGITLAESTAPTATIATPPQTVPNETTSFAITGTTTNATSVSCDPAASNTGTVESFSFTVPLNVGGNTITITASDGETNATATVTITRQETAPQGRARSSCSILGGVFK